MRIIGVALKLAHDIFRLLGTFHRLLVLFKLLRHVIGNELRDEVAISSVAICYCNEPFSSACGRLHDIWNTRRFRFSQLLNEYWVLINFCASCPSHIASHGALSNLLNVEIACDFLWVSTSMLGWWPFSVRILLVEAIDFTVSLWVVRVLIMGLSERLGDLLNRWVYVRLHLLRG